MPTYQLEPDDQAGLDKLKAHALVHLRELHQQSQQNPALSGAVVDLCSDYRTHTFRYDADTDSLIELPPVT